MANEKKTLSFDEKIDPSHTAVVIVDVQNMFCRGPLQNVTGVVIEPIKNFLEKARESGVPIIFIQQDIKAFRDFSLTKELFDRHGRAEIFKEDFDFESAGKLCIEPQPGDFVIRKTTYSSFFETELENKLRELGIKTIIATGVATNVCVETTVRSAFMHGYYAVIPEDLTASYDPELRKAALINMDQNFGEVCKSDKIIDSWKNRE
ncbi:MAG: cysteine hydrolase [Candidatus Schekmanbacteria bacterium]|nr:MAG: cysteine hydrolase [Candidatus Schekmanbacteria bacterium]